MLFFLERTVLLAKYNIFISEVQLQATAEAVYMGALRTVHPEKILSFSAVRCLPFAPHLNGPAHILFPSLFCSHVPQLS